MRACVNGLRTDIQVYMAKLTNIRNFMNIVSGVF